MKLDLGCGPRKRPGFVGVDVRRFPGVDVVLDLREPWPWEDGSVEETFSSHFIEHLTGEERIHFFNELYRVLQPAGRAVIICPNWSHDAAYGDPTHKWPPVSRWTFSYLDRQWRADNAPHVPYTCDFECLVGTRADPNDCWAAEGDEETRRLRMVRHMNTALELVVRLLKR